MEDRIRNRHVQFRKYTLNKLKNLQLKENLMPNCIFYAIYVEKKNVRWVQEVWVVFGGAEAQLMASKVILILVFAEKLVHFYDKVPGL